MEFPTYTSSEYAKYLHKKTKAFIIENNLSITNFPEDMPIKRSTYYLLKSGYLALSIDKIAKLCEHIDIPAPKFVL